MQSSCLFASSLKTIDAHLLVFSPSDHLHKGPFAAIKRLSLISPTARVSIATPAKTMGTSFECEYRPPASIKRVRSGKRDPINHKDFGCPILRRFPFTAVSFFRQPLNVKTAEGLCTPRCEKGEGPFQPGFPYSGMSHLEAPPAYFLHMVCLWLVQGGLQMAGYVAEHGRGPDDVFCPCSVRIPYTETDSGLIEPSQLRGSSHNCRF